MSELSQAEIKELRAENIQDPEFFVTLEAWKEFVSLAVGESKTFHDNRNLLVNYVLSQKVDMGDLLFETEVLELNQHLPQLESALHSSAALRAIVNRIESEIVDFKDAWAIHEGEVGDVQAEKDLESIANLSEWQPVASSRRSSWRLLAACLTVLVASIFVLNTISNEGPTTIAATDLIENVTLPDGSTVRLIPGASIEFFDNEDLAFNRNLKLIEGKAFFDIIKSTKPFTVVTSNSETTVLGTSFGMDSNDFFTEVVLAEGSVVLAGNKDGANKVILEPGQMSRVTAAGDVSRPLGVDVVDALHWTEMFIFRSTSVEDAVDRISTFFGVKVDLEEALLNKKINATYDYGVGVEYILETISESLGADVHRTANGFKMTGK